MLKPSGVLSICTLSLRFLSTSIKCFAIEKKYPASPFGSILVSFHYQFSGRLSRLCGKHPNSSYLMDHAKVCPSCHRQDLVEVDAEVKSKDITKVPGSVPQELKNVRCGISWWCHWWRCCRKRQGLLHKRCHTWIFQGWNEETGFYKELVSWLM